MRTAQGPGLGVKGPPHRQPNRHLGTVPGMAPGIAQPEQEPGKRVGFQRSPEECWVPHLAKPTALPPWFSPAPAAREPRLCLRMDERVRGQVLSLLDLSHCWHPYPHPLGRVWLFFKLVPLLPARSNWAIQHRRGYDPKHKERGRSVQRQ